MFLKRLFANILFVCTHIFGILTLKREKNIAKYLLENALRISTAESCTGGLISSRLTDVSGSSAYIFQNIVTYANDAKIKYLNVKAETIEQHGVVSIEVAGEMAKGLINNFDCTVAIATTGIAGPLGATETKPVGLICIGIADRDKCETYRYEANPLLYRRLMKYAFADKALDLLLDFLKENY